MMGLFWLAISVIGAFTLYAAALFAVNLYAHREANRLIREIEEARGMVRSHQKPALRRVK